MRNYVFESIKENGQFCRSSSKTDNLFFYSDRL